MEKLSHATENILDENVEKLAELFPEVVTEVLNPMGRCVIPSTLRLSKRVLVTLPRVSVSVTSLRGRVSAMPSRRRTAP